MSSFFKGSQLYRQDENGNYRKVNDITPVHHWKLQEEWGSFANDSGLATLLMVGTDTSMDSGKIGISRSFNGTTSFIKTSTVREDSVGSYSAWIYRIGDGSFQSLYSSCRTNSEYYNFNIAITTDNKFTLFVRENSIISYITTTNTIPQNTWTHVVVTSNGTVSKLYINGIEENILIVSGTNNGSWMGDVTSRVNTNIGRTERQTITDYFNGLMEDIRLYDYALSEQEIAIIYNNGEGTHSDSLIKNYPTIEEPINHWKLQEATGTVVNDSSSIASPSSLTNSNCTINQSGITAKAYEFNGTSSKCEAPLPTNMKTATGSFAAWANFGDTAENTEALISVSKPNENTRFVIRRSGTNESIAVLCQESGTYAWNFSFNYQLTNAGWLHIAITQDGTAPKAYVNGVKQSVTFSVDTNKTKWLTYANMNTFNLGVTRAMGDYGFFKGKMFDVRYYDYPLQKYEIENLYNMGNGILIT